MGLNADRQQRKRPDSYPAYLQSKEWLWIRNKVWKRDSGRCVVCDAAGRDVHHRSYRRLGREKMRDLLVLCRSCHEWVHAGQITLPPIKGNKGTGQSRRNVRRIALAAQDPVYVETPHQY